MLDFNHITVTGRLFSCHGHITAGQQLHLLGPNGAGKSTLLSVLAGNLPSKGEIFLDDRLLTHYHVKSLAQCRGYLPQYHSLNNSMRVFHYISLHIVYSVCPDRLQQVISFLADQFQLTEKLGKLTSELSGGEWQRVRLMAIMLQVWPELNPQARLLLLDEPMTSLDVNHQVVVNELIHWLCQHGLMVVLSTHDINQALHHADLVFMIDNGYIIAEGKAKDILTAKKLNTLYHIDFQLIEHQDQHWIVTRI